MNGPDGRSTGSAAQLAARAVRLLRARSETAATAESLTGGLVGAALTEVAGSSVVFRGGLITYATDLKSRLAGVAAPLLVSDGPVAATTASAMAEGAARACGADWGLATTGVAGPDPQDGHPVGQVFVAVAGPRAPGPLAPGPPAESTPAETAGKRPDRARVQELALTGDRAMIRQQTVTAVLELLVAALGED